MSYKYSRYLNRVARQPFAITLDKMTVLWELMRFRAMGHRLSDEEIVARIGDEEERAKPVARQIAVNGQGSDGTGMIAVIPIHGCIAHRADSFEASSGGTSVEAIGAYFRRAVADASVSAILLDFNTPGGGVEGIPELAADIFAARKVKPVWAHINALAASAGYWLASQCEQIVCTVSGQVGSIGVYMLCFDETAFLEKEGIKVNAISAGDNKLEGAPWQELSEESRAHFQTMVDTVYQQFLKAVATGRGVTVADVKKTYGQGRCYDAKVALGLGMIDRIGTVDDAIALISKAASKSRGQVGARADAKEGLRILSAEEIIPSRNTTGDTIEAVTQAQTLRDSLPMFTGATSSIVPIMLTCDASGSLRLVGDWPERTAITLQLLNDADASVLAIDGNEIVITLANGHARYAAVGRGNTFLHDTIVADRGEWLIDHGPSDTAVLALQAQADRDLTATALALAGSGR